MTLRVALDGRTVTAILAFCFAGWPLIAQSHLAGADPSAAATVLITLDTTRADHLGSYGYSLARTPNLDALARRGTRFERCDTAAPITLPSHATILTGLLPPRHGVRDNGTFVLAPRIETLAERFTEKGFDTAAVVSAIVLARRHGLDQGFRIYQDDLGAGYAQGTEVAERHATATTDAAIALLSRLKKPFFLWVHYYDPHEEYRPPTRFAEAAGAEHLYDGEIAYMDAEIGRLLAALPAEARIVVVGDHGEMLGEEGEKTHGLLLGAGARRVPLLVAGPGVPAGQVSPCLVRTVDVAPTLLALAGLAQPTGLDGEPLLPLPDPARCQRQSYSESFLPYFAYRWYPLRAVSDGQELFLAAPQPALFRLDAGGRSRGEVTQPQELESWDRRLRDWLGRLGETLTAAVRAENVLNDNQRRQLAALGYLGTASGGGEISADLPDPRQRTAVAASLHDAARLVQEKRYREALPALQAIVAEDPHNFPALTLAGLCLKETGRLDTALKLFMQAAKENELSAVGPANAAGVLLALGRQADAEREYRHALALDPSLPEAATNLARLLREKAERGAALRVLDEAIAAGALAAEVYLERGVGRAESGKVTEALDDFREAARRDPADPVPLDNAARAAYQLGRAREAATHYEALLRLAPDRLDVLKTLGSLYLYELEDRPAALALFRRALRLEPEPGERQKLLALIAELGG